jgi:outer membrane protein
MVGTVPNQVPDIVMPRRLFVAAVLAVPGILGAQQPAVPASLSLADALAIARDHNPAYRQALNDRGPAAWATRSSFANLFLPSVTATGGMGYTGVGEQVFLTSSFSQSASSLSSYYTLQLDYRLNSQTLTAPGAARAEQRATDADVETVRRRLEFDVTTQYLTVLQATENERVASRQVDNNRESLRLAQARYGVGQVTLVDVRRAEVAQGNSEVLHLRARAAIEAEKLRLFERLGVQAPADRAVQLTDSFAVQEPTWQLQDLLTLAEEQNPALRALRERERAAGHRTRAAWGSFAPTVSLSASWTGFTQELTDLDPAIRGAQSQAAAAYGSCATNDSVRTGAGLAPLGCNQYVWGSQQEAALRAANDQFPFGFTSQPFRARIDISLPLFTNFNRSYDVSQAKALEDNLAESVRAQALFVVTAVSEAFLSLQTAHRAVQIQEQNRRASEESLQLATERYRVGSGTFFELNDAQLADLTAQFDYVNSIYDYHKALALLEAAVGRSLR